ncbi:MAG: protein kinase [Candidatus Competibacteraceae bacterium]|jgi:serine/threonine-protein kinase PpkA|nr:protein kinase [Candidatus Competibacteraceae bacterium]
MEIPGYRIEQELGRGGMATVYLATQESLSRHVALKIVAPTLAADSNFTARFLKEGRIIAQLNHPNVITIFDCGAYGNYYYLSMEYLSGGTLEDRITQGLPLVDALEIIKSMASALGYAHDKGFIHRDVKPLNIMFRREGTPVLTDFGIAKFMEGSTQLTAPGIALGSLRYMSPEQVRGFDIDARSDLYSLGIVFFKMLTGRLPYEAEDPMVVAVMHSTAPLPMLSPELAKFQPVLDKLLAKEVDDRFQNAGQIVDAINRIQLGRSPFDDGTVKAVTRSKPPKRMRSTFSQEAEEEPGRPLLKRPMTLGLIGSVLLVGSGTYLAIQWPLPWLESILPSGSPPDGAADAVAYYQRQAENLLDEGKKQEALLQIDAGLQINSQHAGLKQLKQRIRDALANERKIKQLLAQAEQQQEQMRLVQPPGDNAYESYQQVLVLDTENVPAKEGIARIIDSYRQQAEELRDQGQWQDSLARIDEILQVFPENSGLQSLRGEVLQAFAAARGQEKLRGEIEQLLTQAEQYLQQTQLLQPPGTNAYEAYQQVLALDAENTRAHEGLERIIDSYRQQAEELRDQGQWQDSLATIDEILQVFPDDSGMRSLRSEVQNAFNAAQDQEELQQKITQLVDQAEQYRQQGQFTQPADANAYQTFRQVLQLDPNNAAAQAGLNRLTQDILQQAQQFQQQGELAASMSSIEKGLRVAPQNQDLQALRTQVKEAIIVEQEIAQRLARAQQYWNQKTQLTQPPEDNAAENYQRVLELDANNVEAQQGLEQLTAYFLQQAKQLEREEQLQESLAKIAEGLIVSPQNKLLLALQEQVQGELSNRETARAEAERRQQEINQLLEQAQRQLDDSKLDTPAGDNAYESYQAVLTLDPDNQQARQGLATLADRFEQLAEQQSQQGDFQASLETINKGLLIAPDHKGLRPLLEQVQAKRTEELEQSQEGEQQQRITQLLEQAEQQLERLRLTLPAGNNAYETYQQILELDPENEQAKQGFQAIGDRYLELAERHQSNGSLQASLNSIAKGLGVAPDHSELLALRKTVQSAFAQQEQRRKAEEAQRRQAESERRRSAEEARRKAAEAERRRQANLQQQRQTEQARREAAEAERRRQAKLEEQRQAEEARRQAEQARRQQAEIERQRAAEEAARRQAREEPKAAPEKPRIFGTF